MASTCQVHWINPCCFRLVVWYVCFVWHAVLIAYPLRQWRWAPWHLACMFTASVLRSIHVASKAFWGCEAGIYSAGVVLLGVTLLLLLLPILLHGSGHA